MLNGTRFDSIQEQDILQLIDNGVREGLLLEYKRDRYGQSDADKKEFLKDISSFANRSGGHLIIGINEQDGIAASISAIPEDQIDQELQRLESLARDSIEPRIPSINFRSLSVSGGAVILIRIGPSWSLPHRTAFKNSNRFFGRNSAGSYELSMDEIRALFLSGQTLAQRAEKFVKERLEALPYGPIIPLHRSNQGILALHLVPLNSLALNQAFDPNIVDRYSHDFRPMDSMGFSRMLNLHGLLVYQGGDSCTGYTQIFRNGCVEALAIGATKHRTNDEGETERYIPSFSVAKWLLEGLCSYMDGLHNIEASPPILVSISFIDAHNSKLSVKNPDYYGKHPNFNSQNIILPSFIISEFGTHESYAHELSKAMDILWNAFNYNRCTLFNMDRRWIGEQ